MKIRGAFTRQLSRPARTIMHILACILCLSVIYIAVGSPAFTPKTQYRRLEKSHLIGPATILGTETISESNGEKILIAQTNSQVMLYRYHEGIRVTSSDLVCRQKTGSLTVLAAGGQNPILRNHRGITLPVILFDNHPHAVRAELEITLTGDRLEDKYDPDLRFEKHYTLEATRINSGYFYFTIFQEANGDQRVADLLQRLADISSSNSRSSYIGSIPVNVRLYDNSNTLIHTELLHIRSVKAEATS